ncbi:MAG: hypothetical protein GY758_12185 [Fuerstiella sp.]|nr:hypothetical protein [Fuerstiella sp.]MCP4783846.1 hypothetical protein [Fuerstiella sp.]MCP4857669.1 hypothetical protein [Fuerstiella sp.]
MSLSRFLCRLRKRILGRRAPTNIGATGKMRVMRLEERQLLDAGFGITAAGILQMDGFDMGDALVIESGPTLDSFQFELEQGNWFADPENPHILSGRALISDAGRTLTIDNSQAQLTPITAIDIDSQTLQPTHGVVTPLSGELASVSSLNEFVVSDLVITGGGVINLTGADFDTLSVDGISLDVTDNDDLELGDLSLTGTLTVTAGGDITDADGATMDVGGNASFTGANIALGGGANDELHFGSLQFNSSGDIGITETDSMHLVGNSTAANANLQATGDIDVDADTTVRSEGGRVILEAGADGTLSVSGTVNVSSSTSAGGTVHLLGGKVGLFPDAHISASGETGGGTILVGGDFQGSNADVMNSRITFIGSDVLIEANAVSEGDGGTVIVWADDTTLFNGHIDSQGGAIDGNGGFAEVSGKGFLSFNGGVSLASLTDGTNGTLLLDPDTITVQAATPDIDGAISVAMDDITALTDLDDAAADFTGADSIITAGAVNTLLTGANLLELKAATAIAINAAITGSGTASITLVAPDINIGADITVGGEVRFDGAVTQTTDVTYTGVDTDADAEGIDFGSTLAGGGFDVTIVGGAGFAAAVSGVKDLAADHIDSESTISATTVTISGTSDIGGDVTTTGEQVYTGAVMIEGGDRTLTGSDLTFGSTLDGAQNLFLVVSGATTFSGAVGGTTALSSLTTDAGGTLAINGGGVSTTGGQTYNDAVTLGATTSLSGVGLAFSSTIDTGGHGLTLDSTTAGDITLSGTLSGGGDLIVVEGAVQSYREVVVDSFSVMDASTSVTFRGAVDVTDDLLIVSRGTVGQTTAGRIVASNLGINLAGIAGNVALGSAANDVDVLAIRNTTVAGEILFFDADDLSIDVVSGNAVFPAFPTTAGIDSNAGDINITSGGNLTVSRSIDAAHNSLTTSVDETITLISRNGDVTLADNTIISSDENTAAGSFDDITGDKLTIIAGSASGSGSVTLGNNIEVRTDGGVAKQIVPRPTAFAATGTVNDAAFVTLADSVNMRGSLTSVGGEFLGALNLLFGVTGEENLEVVVDWGVVTLTDLTASGPAGDAAPTLTPDEFEFSLDDADKTIFHIDQGGKDYIIPHLYAAFDLTVSTNDRNGREVNPGLIGVRFSVAQHESINVWGGATPDVPAFDPLGAPGAFVVIDATGQAVAPTTAALALLSSTDTNPLRSLSQEAAQLPFGNLDPTPTGAPLGLAEWEFLTGPAPGFLALPPQERPTTETPLAETQIFSAIVSKIPGDIEFGAGAASDAAVGTEVYLQIRRQFELDADAEIVISIIRDNTFISKRGSFEDFIRDNPELTDGAGYEVWLITETDGQKIERPIVKFEITGGRPGPATEELPQTFEPYELKELEFEQPVEVRPSHEIDTDGPGAETSQTERPTAGILSEQKAPVVDQLTPSDRTTSSSHGVADKDGEGEEVEDAAVKEGVSGLLLVGLTRAARWRRQAEGRQPGLRRASRLIRKMQTRLDNGISE